MNKIKTILASDEFIRKYGRTLEIRQAADARIRDKHHRAVPRYDEPITLPSLDLTEHDLSVRWEREEDREFLPAMLSCRERQLGEALRELRRLREEKKHA